MVNFDLTCPNLIILVFPEPSDDLWKRLWEKAKRQFRDLGTAGALSGPCEELAILLLKRGIDNLMFVLKCLCTFGAERGIGNWVLDCVYKVVPNANIEDIRLLDLDMSDQFSFPMLWWLSNILMLVWELRINKKSIQLYYIRAEMECWINILRKTRLSWSVPMIESYLNL